MEVITLVGTVPALKKISLKEILPKVMKIKIMPNKKPKSPIRFITKAFRAALL